MVIQDWKTVRSGDTTKFVFTLKHPKTKTVIDVSTASAQVANFIGPRKQTITKSTTFTTDGTDGKVECTMSTTDLVQVGEWSAQAKVTLSGGGVYHSKEVVFEVERSL